ncbi:nicotinate-nucleotide adenylyltransferase [bacterium]|nr:nicotinate-nucleotide adenylyltransferase [bacterium]
MRVGILGGSFDPIHIGHLIAAETVREAFQLDRVLFIPAYRPPHKTDFPVAPPALRLKMTEAAIRSHIGFAVSDMEILRAGTSYTVDTLSELASRDPGSKLYFILGSDLLADLPNWRRWPDARKLATFVGVHRPGQPPGDPPKDLQDLGLVKLLEIPGVAISSSLIRARVAAGKSIRYLVPAQVQDIIEEEGLYRDGRQAA